MDGKGGSDKTPDTCPEFVAPIPALCHCFVGKQKHDSLPVRANYIMPASPALKGNGAVPPSIVVVGWPMGPKP